MRVFLVTLVLAVACLLDVYGAADDRDAILLQAAKTKKICIDNTAVKPASIVEINKKNFENPSEELVKYVKCYFEKSGVVNADGSLNLETAVKVLPPDVDTATGRKILESCKDKKAETPELTTYEIFKCFNGNPQINSAQPLL